MRYEYLTFLAILVLVSPMNVMLSWDVLVPLVVVHVRVLGHLGGDGDLLGVSLAIATHLIFSWT